MTITHGLDWQDFGRSLESIPFSLDPPRVKEKSRDFYWFSPVLRRTLCGKYGDILVMPRSEADVMKVAKRCVEWKVPLTVRGAGTGNYGQAMPLEGGVILEMTAMNAIRWLRPGMIRCEAGLKLIDLDTEVQKMGWELRLHPSTRRTATLGGFVAGGSSGIGAIQYGLLRDPGNINGLRIVTLEDKPQALELRGPDIQKVNHAYGTNGIITELEMPLSPAYPWTDTLVAFDDFMAAARFAQVLSQADGIIKKEISVYAWPIPAYFKPIRASCPAGKAIAIVMVAEPSEEAFQFLVTACGGQLTYRRSGEEAKRTVPLYEFTWNHTTLHALKADRSITYLQSLFPPGRNLELAEHMIATFGEEVPMHLEFVRLEGQIGCFGIQLVKFHSEERLNEIIRYHEDHGVPVFNPHTSTLEDGGMKVVDPLQLGFKREVDPYGLLNPGKMRGWWEDKTVQVHDGALYR
jgi:FAD/FMN-containing dehydrogenase